MKPLVSVIVPVYNVEKYLHKCIDSILSQTYRELEIILVDDGSTDSSPQICDEYASGDSRVKVLHQPNKGVAETRNVALSLVTGEYVCFVDSDDYIDERMCELLVDKFSQTKADIIVFDYFIVDNKGNVLASTLNLAERQLSTEDALCELMRENITDHLCFKMYKAKVLESVVFPAGREWEDMAVNYKAFLNAESVCCISEKFYYYYMRTDSIIHSISLKALCDIFYARYTRYIELGTCYPYAAELAFPLVALSALNLYDRSLWEKSEREEVSTAIKFLADNREKVLKAHKSMRYRLYYSVPWLYRFLRKIKHLVGNVVKALRAKH